MSKIPIDTEKRISQEFKKRILELIEDSDSNKKQFGIDVGISNEIVSRITIYGIIPSVRTLIKIADYYDLSLPYLLAETDTNDFIKSKSPARFIDRLKELMQENKVNYGTLAKTMPFGSNYFNEWERVGTLPSLEYLQAIAEHFNVSPDYLLGRTDYKN